MRTTSRIIIPETEVLSDTFCEGDDVLRRSLGIKIPGEMLANNQRREQAYHPTRWGRLLPASLLAVAIFASCAIQGNGVDSDRIETMSLQDLENMGSIHKEAILAFLECADASGVETRGPWRGPDGNMLYLVSSPVKEVDRTNEAVQDCYETWALEIDIEYQLALERLNQPTGIPQTLVAEAMRDAPWDCIAADSHTFDHLWAFWEEDPEQYLSCIFDQG